MTLLDCIKRLALKHRRSVHMPCTVWPQSGWPAYEQNSRLQEKQPARQAFCFFMTKCHIAQRLCDLLLAPGCTPVFPRMRHPREMHQPNHSLTWLSQTQAAASLCESASPKSWATDHGVATASQSTHFGGTGQASGVSRTTPWLTCRLILADSGTGTPAAFPLHARPVIPPQVTLQE